MSSAWCFETGPYGEGHTVFQATQACAPCVETRPCPYNVACLSPFETPEAAQALRGKEPAAWPENLALLRSVCDDLGCDYLPMRGNETEREGRAALRALLAEYHGQANAVAIPGWAAETVFHETDWILPPLRADDFSARFIEGE